MMNRKILYNTTVLLFIQYVLVTVIMMLFYDAGNRFAPDATHFVWDQNYLSDLGRSIGFSGADNPSYIFYSLTLCSVGIGIFLFFFQIQNTMNHKAKYLMVLLATVSAMGYIGIAAYPVDIDIKTHIIYGRVAFFSFFLTSLLAHVLLNKQQYKFANMLFYGLNTLLFAYLLLMFFGPSSSLGSWALQLKTIAQKITVYSQIALSILILHNIHKKT